MLTLHRDCTRGVATLVACWMLPAAVVSLNFTSAGRGNPSIFGDHMVLQQAPAKAAVYGMLNSSDTTRTVAVTVAGSSSPEASYTVQATVTGDRWKALLHPTAKGGDYSITVTAGKNTLKLLHVTFGDVYYCSGQSNMAVSIGHTLGRNKSMDAIRAGKLTNIRIHGLAGNMNRPQPWETLAMALGNYTTPAWADPQHPVTCAFLDFSSTCYYFGESLTEALGVDAPPIGLVHTAWGGSMIEQWLDNATIATCGNVSKGPANQMFHDQYVMPYVDMVLKGFVWYQGENDMHTLFGNSLAGTGYACLMEKLVSQWRSLWSATAGTTDPLAPFGLVTLPDTGSEGGSDIGSMRQAQTASYGVTPNPVLPQVFSAQGYDLVDPWRNDSCYFSQCWPANASQGNAGCFVGQNASTDVCGWKNATIAKKCHGCEGYIHSVAFNNWYMGPIHGRAKKPVGDRLAASLAALSYGKPGPVTGPTIAGCKKSGNKITVSFNESLLAGGKMIVQPYYKGGVGSSKMHVLVNSSLFCFQTSPGKKGAPGLACMDDGSGKWKSSYPPGPVFHDSNSFPADKEWVAVDIATGTNLNEVVLDLTKTNGTAFAIRYAWSGDCCTDTEVTNKTSAPCPLESCPLMATYPSAIGAVKQLPPNPFQAKIVADKCECIAPQVCDA